MSRLNVHKCQSYSFMELRVFDGKFADKPQKAPYFYFTHHDDLASTTISFEATEASVAQLREMADQLEEYWADWDAKNEKEPAA